VQNYLGFNPGADSHFGTWFQVLHSAFGSSSDDPYTATVDSFPTTIDDRGSSKPSPSFLVVVVARGGVSLQEGRKEGGKGVRRPKEQSRLFPSQYANCRLLRGIILGEAPSL
jgi:hypothetical protein